MSIAIVLMGVSGSGKSTVGKQLSQRTGLPFFDGDDYHPQGNVLKMAAGKPLTDEDRHPWLETLHELIVNSLARGESLILASSALKETYRNTLRGDFGERVMFVHLQGDFELIYRRMEDRRGHFMEKDMLHSQFETLEKPKDGLTVDIDQPIPAIVDEIMDTFQLGQD